MAPNPQINTKRMVAALTRMVRQPSVSATGQGIPECAALTRDILEENGIGARLLSAGDVAPLVYGEIDMGRPRTVLFYNHYDVQPAEPLDLWEHPPFGGVVSDGKVYGRGATDDKGELAARIEAVRTLADAGKLGCNVKFAVEGNEENGSVGMSRYLNKYKGLLGCDGIVWEFGYVNDADVPIVGLGMKGMLYATLGARGPGRDIHSGMAPIVQSPAWRLVSALASLAGPDGRIKIPDWYEGAQPLTPREREMLEAMPLDADSLKKDMGITEFVLGQDEAGARQDLAEVATCNIAGIWSGHTGEGTKTVLPSVATAKLDLRLVPGMDPQAQAGRLRRHLDKSGFADVSMQVEHGQRGIRASPSHPFVRAVIRAADAAFGSHLLNIMYPETGPIWQFSTILGAPCVLVGGSHVHSRMHSPNEFARIDLLEKTARAIIHVLGTFGADSPQEADSV